MIYWADLHNHNEIGYGEGSLERSYALAENLLDVYAFTPHGYWPDPPASDPKLASYHQQGAEKALHAFPRVVEMARARYRPGRFVTFAAYEWHSLKWGDYVVLFPGDAAELRRAANAGELQEFARRAGALLIPHHVAYARGSRGLDWDAFDPSVSPLVEVFSEHGNSLEREGPGAMLAHSMGGAIFSQTAMEQLRQKKHFGLTAGTDDHYGCPANYGEGITGIVAAELTREAISDALRKRHTLAATGDRIEVRFASGDGIMGDSLPASAAREFDIAVNALAPIEYIQVVRDGQPAATWPGPPPQAPARDGSYLVRIEWGWGRMQHEAMTDWAISVHASGKILRWFPCFCGGADSAEKIHRVARTAPNALRVESFTSRRNISPVSGLVLVLEEGDLQVTAEAKAADGSGTCEIRTSVGALREDDLWAQPLKRFSSPRIRISRALPAASLAQQVRWRDPNAGASSYLVKVRQQNGHVAWTSPISFRPVVNNPS